MAIIEQETKHIEALAEAFIELVRPPEYLRREVDIVYRIQAQSVEIIEVRVHLLDPGKKIEMHVAKTTYIRTQD